MRGNRAAGQVCGRLAGHANQCRSLVSLKRSSDKNALSQAANRDQVLRDRKDYYRTVHGRATILCNGAKNRARVKGIPFDLTVEWVERNLRSALEAGCPLLGIVITLDSAHMGNPPDSPSIDRKDPQRGYTQDNCWIVSHQANAMKNAATRDELLMFAKNITQFFTD
jgi:hypothetical protein